MRTIWFYVTVLFYTLGMEFKKWKLDIIRKYGSKEKADKYIFLTASSWGKFALNRAGVKVRVVGAENIPKETCLFVGNHQSDFDIPLVLGRIDKQAGFIAKKEIEKIPIVRTWMREMHCVFMDRDNPRDSVKSILEGIEFLKNGNSLIVFPEGTRSKGKQLGEFKKGSMKLATKSGVPIVPITINGTYKIYEGNGYKVTPEEVDLIISKPIYLDKLSKEEQNNLAELVKGIIRDNLQQIN